MTFDPYNPHDDGPPENVPEPGWRYLKDNESPFMSVGNGLGKGGGEICCPLFNTHARYMVAMSYRLGRVAKQDKHVLIRAQIPPGNMECECACGLVFLRKDAKLRAIS